MDDEPKTAAIQTCFYSIFGKDVGVLGLNAVYDLLWQIVWQKRKTFLYIQVNGETRDITGTLIWF